MKKLGQVIISYDRAWAGIVLSVSGTQVTFLMMWDICSSPWSGIKTVDLSSYHAEMVDFETLV